MKVLLTFLQIKMLTPPIELEYILDSFELLGIDVSFSHTNDLFSIQTLQMKWSLQNIVSILIWKIPKVEYFIPI